MYFQNKKKIRTFKIYCHFGKIAKMRHYRGKRAKSGSNLQIFHFYYI